MKRVILISVLVFSVLALTNAQDYKTGIGLRAGYPAGLTLKHYLNRTAAFEGLLSTRWRGFEITGLYEINKPAFDINRLNWYYGFGAHVGFWNGRYTSSYWGTYGDQYTVVGIDGILGLEYNFEEIPVNLSLDWKPAFNVVGYTGFWYDGVALSLRYIF
jgi:hypothetical protein